MVCVEQTTPIVLTYDLPASPGGRSVGRRGRQVVILADKSELVKCYATNSEKWQ
jgi:hypothetical protein